MRIATTTISPVTKADGPLSISCSCFSLLLPNAVVMHLHHRRTQGKLDLMVLLFDLLFSGVLRQRQLTGSCTKLGTLGIECTKLLLGGIFRN